MQSALQQTICLVMIVRNEAAVIRRCLESIKPWLSHWVICDTGSTDGTQTILRDVLAGIPGELHQVPWVDFGQNRSQAVALARGKADYHLLFDADMVLVAREEFRSGLMADSYLIRFDEAWEYYLPLLVSDRHEWRYAGVTHECVQSFTAKSQEKLPALSVLHYCDGANRADKFERDIGLLSRALESEPENARYTFYLAQSYRDLGLGGQAVEWYGRRTLMGGFEEEVWQSFYQIARLKHASALPWPQVLCAYLAAYQRRPGRLEPLLPVARHYREQGQYHLGFMFSRAVTEIPYPEDILFIERPVYEWELPLEYAVCCYWLGLHEEALRVYDRMLALPRLPAACRQEAERNRQLSVVALKDREGP